MSDYIMAKTRKRYTRLEWNNMTSEEQDAILKKEGPAYTDEAWKNHFERQDVKRKIRR